MQQELELSHHHQHLNRNLKLLKALGLELEEAKNETFVIPTTSSPSPWGLTFGFHKNRNVEILKADTVKGIRNGKLGLLWILENNILVGPVMDKRTRSVRFRLIPTHLGDAVQRQ